MENGKRKVYGAAILSSPEETEHAINGDAEYRRFNIPHIVNSKKEVSDRKLQTLYYVGDSFQAVHQEVIDYCKKMKSDNAQWFIK